jgi:hypothetical protein
MGRNKIYPDSAARLAAYRARKIRVEILLDVKLHKTLAEIAEYLDTDISSVIRSNIKFALTNHNYKTMGLTHEKTG